MKRHSIREPQTDGGRAVEIAGIPRADSIDALAARKIEVAQIDFDSLARELERV